MSGCNTQPPQLSPASVNSEAVLTKIGDVVNFVGELAQNAYTEAVSTLGSISTIVSSAMGNIDTNINCSGGDYEGDSITGLLGPVPTPPDLGDLTPPDPIDTEYNETLPQLTNLGTLVFNTLYDEIVNGSTGLTQSVMDDMYSWEEEKDLQDLQDTKDREATDWARNGSILPDSCLYSIQAWADVTYQNKKAMKSRDIRIESFKMAFENAKFNKDLAVKLEDIIFKYLGDYWNRRIEYVTGIWKYGYIAYDYLLKWKMALVELYKAEAEGYGAMARIAQAEATVSAAELDARSRYDVACIQAQADTIKAEIEKLRAQAQLGSDAISGISRVGAALASGAMSAINTGANMSYDGRTEEQSSIINYASCNENYSGEID